MGVVTSCLQRRTSLKGPLGEDMVSLIYSSRSVGSTHLVDNLMTERKQSHYQVALAWGAQAP